MKKNLDNQTLVQYAYDKLPPTWSDRVPQISKENWENAKVLLSSDSYTPLRNQIYDELINRIGLTVFIENNYNNPLSPFKSGAMEYGDTYQEITTDIVEGQEFRGGGDKVINDDQFAIFGNDVASAYFRINRKMYYPTTIEDVIIRRAFVDQNGLSQLLTALINKLQGSNTVEEYIFTKRLIFEYYQNKEKPLLPTQKIKVPDIRNNPSVADIKSFIQTVRLIGKSMTFNSRNYNPQQNMMAVNPANMVLILDYRASIINEVQNLSGLYNPQYNALNMPIIDIDDFSDDKGTVNNKIIGLMCDRRLLDIKNIEVRFTQADNARGLYRNHFLHIHQLYKASPFVPAVFFECN